MRTNPLKLTAIALMIWISNPSIYALEYLKPLQTDNPPVIDGELNDPIWQKAPSITGFKTWVPDYGNKMQDETEVYMAYDNKNLYFAFRCFDSEPDKIKTSITSRDNIINDDWIRISLDSFNDQQSFYTFYVNPMGIQMDARSIGDNEDYSVDMVWYSVGKIDEKGYLIEVCIPLKSIRYSDENPTKMGIIFERSISRTSEMGTYPPLNPKKGPNFYTQTQTIQYQDIKHYNLVEILPAFTCGYSSLRETGKMTAQDSQKDISLTAKIGITSDLVFDGTYNPDFSQVEADAGQVDFNLRYALFYEEKRAFFLEGIEHFNFGASSMGAPLSKIVHTRTIVNPLIGTKLTGKLGEKNTFASIYAMDEHLDGSQKNEKAHLGILRYKRSLADDGYVGGFVTVRETKPSYNRVVGIDGKLCITEPSRFGFHSFFSGSHIVEANEKQKGHAIGFDYLYDTRDWMIYIQMQDLSKDFETKVGYLTRTGMTRVGINMYRMLYPKAKLFLRIWPMFVNRFIHDKESDLWEHYYAFVITTTLPRSTRLRLGYTHSSEIFLSEVFSTSFYRSEIFSQLTKQLHVYLDYIYGMKIRYVSDPFQGKGHVARMNITYQPADKMNSNLDIIYNDFYRKSNGKKEFDYTIIRLKNTYQANKYLFFRFILEYNLFQKEMITDFLASFTSIPGTVLHLGYGSLYQKTKWDEDEYISSHQFHEMKRDFFFKASYLWRL